MQNIFQSQILTDLKKNLEIFPSSPIRFPWARDHTHQQRNWLDGLSKFSTVYMLTFGGTVNVQKCTVEIYGWSPIEINGNTY